MNTPSSTVTIWESGRLVVAQPARRDGFTPTREHWIVAGLLVLCAVVMTLYVLVLERDVGRGEIAQTEQHSRAVAEAQCESTRSAAERGGCVGILHGDAVAVARDDAPAADVPPPNDVDDTDAHVSTAAQPSLAALQQ